MEDHRRMVNNVKGNQEGQIVEKEDNVVNDLEINKEPYFFDFISKVIIGVGINMEHTIQV